VVIDGRPVDFAIEAADRRLRRDKAPPVGPEEIVYLRVPVPTEALPAFVLKYKVAGPWAHMHYLGATQLFVF
jgi:hypothetical protein